MYLTGCLLLIGNPTGFRRMSKSWKEHVGSIGFSNWYRKPDLALLLGEVPFRPKNGDNHLRALKRGRSYCRFPQPRVAFARKNWFLIMILSGAHLPGVIYINPLQGFSKLKIWLDWSWLILFLFTFSVNLFQDYKLSFRLSSKLKINVQKLIFQAWK